MIQDRAWIRTVLIIGASTNKTARGIDLFDGGNLKKSKCIP